jgi:selenocysteine lyase/cysteine desulfurase
LLDELRQQARVRFFLLDAAQAINHVYLREAARAADFTIAGTHKWLRAFEPMGVGLYSRSGSRSFIRSAIELDLARNHLADPLLRFVETEGRGKETVNLQPLFAASGAIADSLAIQSCEKESSAIRTRILQTIEEADWTPAKLHPDFATRIVLANKKSQEHAAANAIRKFMMKFGVAVSDFGGGQCRISSPGSLSVDDQSQLRLALAKY